jgi:glyoxylase I family protein
MTAIQHVAFNCMDLKKTEDFYTKHFGFRRARVFNAGKPNEFLLLRRDKFCLEIFPAKNAQDAVQAEQPLGFKHMAFEVDNIEEAVIKLNADGVKTDNIIDCSAIIKGMRICFFNDPDGNRIELMQGYKDQF